MFLVCGVSDMILGEHRYRRGTCLKASASNTSIKQTRAPGTRRGFVGPVDRPVQRRAGAPHHVIFAQSDSQPVEHVKLQFAGWEAATERRSAAPRPD